MREDIKQQVAQGREVIGSDREQFLLLDCVRPSSQPHVCHVALMLHAFWHMTSMLHNHLFFVSTGALEDRRFESKLRQIFYGKKM